MTAAGDVARVEVLVEVEPAEAFRVFTEEIDRWWRRGVRYRVGGGRSVVLLEPGVGGRLLEQLSNGQIVETGQVTAWQPPGRLVLEWRAVNFAPGEKTEVEVRFAPSPSGTRVTLEHRGWSRVRADHPVRHGQEVPAFIRGIGMWWGDLLTSLRLHVAERPSA